MFSGLLVKLASSLITRLFSFLAGLVMDWFDIQNQKRKIADAAKKAVNEKDTDDIDSIMSGL